MKGIINFLDETTINKIAAGEVIERPASVIKELVENSIDAKSDSIVIEIKNGGKQYIRITDNGNGISTDDLDIAFLRHTTSKIINSDDLSNIHTLGFRGEALSSITAVSQVEVITKTLEANYGMQLNVTGGKIIDKTDVGCPKGTTFIVRNLFFNVPVRKKFLKSDTTESSYVSEIIFKLALSYPRISFKYIRDGKLIFKTSGKGDLLSCIYSLYGKSYIQSLINVAYNDDIKIHGYISKPELSRGNRKHQFFYVNGRCIQSDILSKAVQDAYKTLITINNFPIVFLFIEVEPSSIDVNIHPSKSEIRFDDDNHIYNILKKVIKDTLFKKDLIHTNETKTTSDKKYDKKIEYLDLISNIKPNNYIKSSFKKDYVKDNSKESKYKSEQITIYNQDNNKLTSKVNNPVSYIKKEPMIIEKETQIQIDKPIEPDTVIESEDTKHNFPELRYICTLFSTYIIAADKITEELYMIDQHAAHERVMYEKIYNQHEKNEILKQELITPITIDMTNHELLTINENKSILDKLGFEIEDFGNNSILLRSVPALLNIKGLKKFFIEILDHLKDISKKPQDYRLKYIMKLACTTAVKGGDNLKEIEIESLFKQLQMLENPYTCPHGRPTIVKLSKHELEKKFKRIQ
ncbi:DNA mismatch repair endonuclease MutL [Abyssisolibacter fermentans]|uniref:DNA mismatch repair endonuclease MutL n=1 Tax=Abyssisolibacter fermentans TaxID=1766203 RepID=UPI00083734C9|nr:DNA mismatch repair endonuclease MutL [Abyssisolibacter fermentans]